MRDPSGPNDSDRWKDLAPLLDGGLTQLRPKYRDVVLLRFFQGKDVDEISATLGVSEGTARKRLGRAIEKLRAYFAAQRVAMPAATFETAMLAHGAGATVPAALSHAVLSAPSAAAKALAGSVSLPSAWAMKIAGIVTAVAVVVVVVVVATPPSHPPVTHERHRNGSTKKPLLTSTAYPCNHADERR